MALYSLIRTFATMLLLTVIFVAFIGLGLLVFFVGMAVIVSVASKAFFKEAGDNR